MQITKDAESVPRTLLPEKLQNRQSKRQLIENNAKATKQKHRGERSSGYGENNSAIHGENAWLRVKENLPGQRHSQKQQESR